MQKKISLLLLCTLSLAISNACKNSSKSTTDQPVPPLQSLSEEESKKEETDPFIDEGLWTIYKSDDLPDLERNVEPTQFDLWRCDYSRFTEALYSDPSNIQIPFDGKLLTFELINSSVMAPGLAAKFPDVKTYKGKSKEGNVQARVDINKNGIYAEMYNAKTKLILSPYLKESTAFYAQYPESSLPAPSRDDSFK